jgi:hypothetical protein
MEKCHHTEPGPMSDTEIRQRKMELQVQHWCEICDRQIFSQFFMAWALKHNAVKAGEGPERLRHGR